MENWYLFLEIFKMPIRTSLVSGKKGEATDFLRFTARGGRLIFDPPGRKNPGRGGYVERSSAMIEKLSSKKILGKVAHFLRVKKISIDQKTLREVSQKNIFSKKPPIFTGKN